MVKYSLITGASSGIGLEMARILAKHKKNLVLVARNKEKLEILSHELKDQFGIYILVIVKDLSLPDSVEKLFNELEANEIEIEILINNAGFGDLTHFYKSNWEKTRQMIDLNIMALTHLTRLFLPSMIKAKSGKILNIASTAAFQPGPYMAVYYASKAYVLYFSEAIAEELKGTGVTVTALCPGPTNSGFQDEAGINGIKLLRLIKADRASEVAQYGYDSMIKGKSVAVYGMMNALMAFSIRFTPRKLAVKLIANLQKN
jgi:uncharacterized protein